MAIIERHTSPDGLLELCVDRGEDGDLMIGFTGFQWHTHGDLLVWQFGGTPESATRCFVDSVLNSNWLIVLSWIDGVLHDVWVTSDTGYDEAKNSASNELIEKRYWNGEPFKE